MRIRAAPRTAWLLLAAGKMLKIDSTLTFQNGPSYSQRVSLLMPGLVLLLVTPILGALKPPSLKTTTTTTTTTTPKPEEEVSVRR